MAFSVFTYMRVKTHKKMNNQRQNRIFLDAVHRIEENLGKLSYTEIERLHREVSKKGFSFHEIVQIGEDMFK